VGFHYRLDLWLLPATADRLPNNQRSTTGFSNDRFFLTLPRAGVPTTDDRLPNNQRSTTGFSNDRFS
jgi:hypothetical protein